MQDRNNYVLNQCLTFFIAVMFGGHINFEVLGYNSKSKHYIQTHDIIVAKEFSDDLIESNIFAHDFNINLAQHL